MTEFIRPTNGGLFLLLRLLSNLQNKGTGNGCKSRSASALNRSSSVLENYKQNVVSRITWVYFKLIIIKILLMNRNSYIFWCTGSGCETNWEKGYISWWINNVSRSNVCCESNTSGDKNLCVKHKLECVTWIKILSKLSRKVKTTFAFT